MVSSDKKGGPHTDNGGNVRECDYGQQLPTGNAVVPLGPIQCFAGVGNYPFLAILNLAQDPTQPYIRGVSFQDIGTPIFGEGQYGGSCE